MNIKSLLLGSAAALAVTTGAQAADAIMAAQPEPVDYVRVCDAFGTGYFYIPGTETCLRVHGYIREDIGFGDRNSIHGATLGRGTGVNFDQDNATSFRSRFSFQTDTKSNTELGVLHTYTEVRFTLDNDGTGDGISAGGNLGTSLNYAYIELGGFRVGKTESEFTRMAFYGHGYAGGVIDDTLVPYGPFDTQQVSYTYSNGSGLSAVVALEDDNGGGGNYYPDVVGGLSYDNGTFGAAIVGALDGTNSVDGSGDSDGAIKARIDAKLGRFQAFLMGAYSTNGEDSNDLEQASNHFANWGGDWAVFGGASVDLTQKVSANLQLSYDEVDTFGAAGNLVFHVVPGFDVFTELDYANYDNATRGDDVFGGIIRFQRTF